MKNEQILLLSAAINKWGWASQVEMIKEECLELALALQKLSRVGGREHLMDEKINAVIDEIADVKIMMAQAELLFDKEKIEARINFKMNRLKGRLEK